MAEGVLFNVAARIIGRLGSLAFQEIGLIWGVQDELHKLQEIVAGFQGVLLDAELKQTNNEVKLWLESVEDAVYEADDLLDELNTEAQQRQMMCGNTKMSKKVRLFFSSSNQLAFGLKMGHKIKDINKRLREVASRRAFPLEVNCEDTRFIIRERITHSFVPKENILGRDEDTKTIIQLLLDPISTENVSTISIVGFGGLGKTALAQLIFNDEVIQNHFELKIWSCVSNVFELDILVKKILKVDKIDMDELQNDLRRKVDGKKYLIVLDDVWNENREKWLSLKYLLMGGGKGSRILITTRSEAVAKISDTAKPYTLRGLNQEDSWSLFKEMAFKDGKEPENSTIKAIGKEVARKCQGVPLAIRTIGGMLHTKYHETEWLNFKENKLSRINQEENEILPTLKLSYDVLPSHLKHCFAYCSLFPPDYEISVPMLIRLWMAQGFIKSSGENESLEDVAYEYYMELLCRSFFQEEEKDEFGIITSCKMHDLMNELAISMSGVRSAVVDRNQKKFHEKLRHVSFNFHVDLSEWEVPTSLLKAKKIRTFLLPCLMYNSRPCNSFCATIISNFKSLRMLSLDGMRIIKLPNCLKKVKHLRYLGLSWNPINRLPDWIVGLSNLETLDLSGCHRLVELPRDIKKMINLRHLILEGCVGLNRMPRGLGELNGLRTLNRFVLSENNSLLRDSAAGLGELGRLKELRGELEIRNLRHEKDVMSESNVGTPLKEKQHLHSLHLCWKRGEDVNAIDEKDIIMSMEVLQPHSNLKKLFVWCYGGVRFASWFSSLINLVELRLWGCHRCQHLPPLDHFPSLKFLQLEGFEKLEYISDNTSSSNSMSDEMMKIPFFPSLEELWVFFCPVLKGWWRTHTHNNASSSSSTEDLSLPSFPSLSQLNISGCPNLSSMPLYPNVEGIVLSGCSWKVVDSLFVRGASDITHDVGVDVSASSSSPHLSKLTDLSLNNIEDLECLTSQGMGNVPSLQSLSIADCPNLALLPYHGMGNLASFRELIVINCSNLTSMSEGIANLTSLQKLTVRNCSNLTLPPELVVNLPSLQSLTIESFPNLVSLPEEISNLTSLQQLEIRSCSNLASLPEGIRRLPCLNTLVIEKCPMLSERCKKETGEDWPKIAHIPSIYIY
ncbi:disease resistance protein RGA2-like [Malus sylvestris]|uniref:disease resistance protein RGA2-like n=1 Tax=Malus sylvestris TaxID=3752 RepID=UPI0021AC282F|nr:disease resistance protein RGA2-like [Malus sylvestris]